MSEKSENPEVPQAGATPKGSSFSELLCWHLYTWGTRHDGNNHDRGERWSPKGFVWEMFGSVDNPEHARRRVGYWESGTRPPLDIRIRIADVLFGSKDCFREWRDQLINAPRFIGQSESSPRKLRINLPAEDIFDQAIELMRLGCINQEEYQFEKAQRNFEIAIDILSDSPEYVRQKAEAIFKLSGIYILRWRFDMGEKYCSEALNIYEEIGFIPGVRECQRRLHQLKRLNSP